MPHRQDPLPLVENSVKHDLKLEQQVLGTMLMFNQCIPIVNQLIRSERVFYSDEYRIIFKAIQESMEQFGNVDYSILMAALKGKGKLEMVGGVIAVMDLTKRVVSDAHIQNHCLLLTSYYMLRSTEDFCLKMANRIYDDYGTFKVLDLAEDMGKHVEFLDTMIKVSKYTSLDQVIISEKQRAAMDTENKVKPGYTTGFPTLDKLSGRMMAGDLWIIAARPGMGKTSLAFQMCMHLADEDPKSNIDFWSLEVPAYRIGHRYITLKTGISNKKQLYREMTDEELEAIENMNVPSNIRVFDGDTISVKDMEAYYRSENKQNRPKAIFFDYLQLAIPGSKGYGQRSREQDVAEISRALKRIATTIGVPVIALSQLSRDVEKRGEKRPKLSDLRESGAIEQDADLVMFIYRPSYYKDDDSRNKPGPAELLVEKNRHGSVGTAVINFIPKQMRFHEEDELNSKWNTDLEDTAGF